ncbi:unnamed protein product [Somion occarium]
MSQAESRVHRPSKTLLLGPFSQTGSKSSPLVDMTLNYDVLCIVLFQLSFQSRRGLLCMMRTCKDLHEYGLPVLLGSPIRVQGTNVEDFCRFILSDKVRFGSLLRDITLADCGSHGDPERQIVHYIGDLLEIFKHTSILHRLTFTHTENMWRHAKPLLNLALNHPNINHLLLENLGLQSEPDVEAKNIPAQKISLSFGWKHLHHEVDIEDLAPFQSSLMELRTDLLSFEHANIQFHSMQSLTFDWLPATHFTSKTLSYVFPNLRSLTIHRSTSSNDSFTKAQLVYARTQNRGNVGSETWSQLDHVAGYVEAIYILGLTCKIRHIEAEWDDIQFGKLLNEIVNDCSPRSIAFKTVLTTREAIQGLRDAFRMCLHPSSILLHFCLFDDAISVIDPLVMQDFFDFLRNLSISYIEIHLHPQSKSLKTVGFGWPQGEDHLTSFAECIMRSSKTIQHILVEIPDIGVYFWEVHDDDTIGSGKCLRRVSGMAGRCQDFVPRAQ